MDQSQRQNLLNATNPKGARHHQWDIKFNWGTIHVMPNGDVSSIVIESDKSIPEKLSAIVDELLIQHAQCRINHFTLGKSLIEKVLNQLDEKTTS